MSKSIGQTCSPRCKKCIKIRPHPCNCCRFDPLWTTIGVLFCWQIKIWPSRMGAECVCVLSTWIELLKCRLAPRTCACLSRVWESSALVRPQPVFCLGIWCGFSLLRLFFALFYIKKIVIVELSFRVNSIIESYLGCSLL